MQFFWSKTASGDHAGDSRRGWPASLAIAASLEVVLQGLPSGQGFRCEEVPRAEGAVVAIAIDDEDDGQLHDLRIWIR